MDYEDVDDNSTHGSKPANSTKDSFVKKDNLLGVIGKITEKINFKSLIILFILFLIVSSDIFINCVLTTIKSATDTRGATFKGILIQGVFLVVGFTLLNLLINQKVI